jgi:hypothetical protein
MSTLISDSNEDEGEQDYFDHILTASTQELINELEDRGYHVFHDDYMQSGGASEFLDDDDIVHEVHDRNLYLEILDRAGEQDLTAEIAARGYYVSEYNPDDVGDILIDLYNESLTWPENVMNKLNGYFITHLHRWL